MSGRPEARLGVVGASTPPRADGSTTQIAKAGLRRSLVKFIVVGTVNNVIGYATFVLLSVAGLPAIAAMTISYSVGMVISFAGNRKWTFGHQGKIRRALLRFLAVNAAGYGLNFLILTVFVLCFGLPQIPVQLFTVGLVAVLTFLLMRLWAFRRVSVELEGESTK